VKQHPAWGDARMAGECLLDEAAAAACYDLASRIAAVQGDSPMGVAAAQLRDALCTPAAGAATAAGTAATANGGGSYALATP
jgi:hypothetical protein